MQILNVSQNQLIVVNQIQINLIPQEYQKHEPSGYCFYLKGLDGINDNYIQRNLRMKIFQKNLSTSQNNNTFYLRKILLKSKTSQFNT